MNKQFFAAILTCFVAAASLLFSCNNQPGKSDTASSFNLDSVKAAIAASNKVYGECFASGDSVKFAGSYTADACINPPNMPRMCGTPAISGFFNGAVKMGIKNLIITTEEVMGGENCVSEIGKFEVIGDKDASLDKGKFIVIWKNDNGKWKMYRDVWNSDNPPPSAPAEKK